MTICNTVFTTVENKSFAQAHSLLQTGDILLCSGNGILSDIIKKATNSPFSHVALILKLPITGQWLVLESIESKGVRCVPLEQDYLTNYCGTHKPYDGKILIARIQEMQSKRDIISKLYQTAFSLLGDEYNQEDILQIGARIFNHDLGIKEDGTLLPHQRYICSEYVYTCLHAIGIQIPFDPAGFIAPADIARYAGIHAVTQLQPNVTAISTHTSELLM